MSEHPIDAMLAGASLVADRECGACTACCTLLKIDEPDFRKPPGVTCGHRVGGLGCSIHSTRPDVCRAWYCGWRRLPWLSADMWPPESGILVRVRQVPGGAPAGGTLGLTFQVLTSQLALFEKRVWNAIGTAILNGIPTYLGVSAPAGYEGRVVYLNDALRNALKVADAAAIKRELRRAYVTGRMAPKPKARFSQAVQE